jgi:hypothetical protein
MKDWKLNTRVVLPQLEMFMTRIPLDPSHLFYQIRRDRRGRWIIVRVKSAPRAK